MFVLTFLLKGGLNQMTLRCLFLRGRCVSCGVYSSLWRSCCDLVRSDMLVLRPQMFACQMKVLKCAC